jgi:hypothetical protein
MTTELKMKKLLLVLFMAAVCGVLVAKRAWAFGHSSQTIIRNGLFFFILFLVVGTLVTLIREKP